MHASVHGVTSWRRWCPRNWLLCWSTQLLLCGHTCENNYSARRKAKYCWVTKEAAARWADKHLQHHGNTFVSSHSNRWGSKQLSWAPTAGLGSHSSGGSSSTCTCTSSGVWRGGRMMTIIFLFKQQMRWRQSFSCAGRGAGWGKPQGLFLGRLEGLALPRPGRKEAKVVRKRKQAWEEVWEETERREKSSMLILSWCWLTFTASPWCRFSAAQPGKINISAKVGEWSSTKNYRRQRAHAIPQRNAQYELCKFQIKFRRSHDTNVASESKNVFFTLDIKRSSARCSGVEISFPVGN